MPLGADAEVRVTFLPAAVNFCGSGFRLSLASRESRLEWRANLSPSPLDFWSECGKIEDSHYYVLGNLGTNLEISVALVMKRKDLPYFLLLSTGTAGVRKAQTADSGTSRDVISGSPYCRSTP